MEFWNLAKVGKEIGISKVAVQKRVDSGSMVGFRVLNNKNYKYYIPSELVEFDPNAHKSNGCKVIAVNNLKGGVGKTTVSTNLATTLAIMGKRVLLLDMDPQANATTAFVDMEEFGSIDSIKEIMDMYADKNPPKKERIKEVIRKVEFENYTIDLISSKISLAKSIEYLRTISHTAIFKLDTMLKKIKDDYDYIIIDTPPNASIIMQMCLYASDSILAVTVPEQFPVNSMVELFEEIKSADDEIEEYRGHGIDVFGIVVNNIQNTRVHKAQQENINKIAESMGIDAIYEIPKNIKVAEAQDLRVPLALYKDELDNGGKSIVGILEVAYDLIVGDE
jgi:chromosome partitioning protein